VTIYIYIPDADRVVKLNSKEPPSKYAAKATMIVHSATKAHRWRGDLSGRLRNLAGQFLLQVPVFISEYPPFSTGYEAGAI
jgi:hypothetical protein